MIAVRIGDKIAQRANITEILIVRSNLGNRVEVVAEDKSIISSPFFRTRLLQQPVLIGYGDQMEKSIERIAGGGGKQYEKAESDCMDR